MIPSGILCEGLMLVLSHPSGTGTGLILSLPYLGKLGEKKRRERLYTYVHVNIYMYRYIYMYKMKSLMLEGLNQYRDDISEPKKTKYHLEKWTFKLRTELMIQREEMSLRPLLCKIGVFYVLSWWHCHLSLNKCLLSRLKLISPSSLTTSSRNLLWWWPTHQSLLNALWSHGTKFSFSYLEMTPTNFHGSHMYLLEGRIWSKGYCRVINDNSSSFKWMFSISNHCLRRLQSAWIKGCEVGTTSTFP